MLNVLLPYEKAQRLGVSGNGKIAKKMKKSYEISIVFALGKVDFILFFLILVKIDFMFLSERPTPKSEGPHHSGVEI